MRCLPKELVTYADLREPDSVGICVLRSIPDNSNAVRNMASMNERMQTSGRSQLEWDMLLKAITDMDERLFSGF